MASFRGILNIMLLVLTSDFQSPLTELTRAHRPPTESSASRVVREDILLVRA